MTEATENPGPAPSTESQQRQETQLDKQIEAAGRLTPATKAQLMELLEERWPEDKRPEGFPLFDPNISDGCSAGVRQVAQLCCALHDSDYHYGTTWRDKVRADWALSRCIWHIGNQKIFDPIDPQPLSGLPSWWVTGAFRGIGVLFGGWGAFRKPHKRIAK